MPLEQGFGSNPISKIELLEAELRIFLEEIQARLFQLGIVVVVYTVHTEDCAALRQKTSRDMKPDKAGRTGEQNRIALHCRGPAHRRHSSMPDGIKVRSSFALTSITSPRPLSSNP